MQNYYKQFDTCREHDIPACADACPFKMDFLAVQERISKGRFNAAYKSIRDCVVFPGIVAELCPAYCENSCVRHNTDSSVQIRLLEKSVIANATRKTPNSYNLPVRKKRIAVIGAGLSGMGFAFKMASKKYDVTVFEKSCKIGGQLAELMDETAYMAEFDLQFKNEKYTLNLNSEIKDILKLCSDFDVIYIATGAGGNSFGFPLSGKHKYCKTIGNTGIFVGGGLLGKDLMNSLADGIAIAASAESFLKTGRLEYPVSVNQTGCVLNEDKLTDSPAIATSGDAFTEDECIAEANRCIRCQCDACTSYCDIVDYFNKMPVKMRDEIFLSCKPAGSLVHKSPARKYVAACTMCGLMEEACPEHIDLCGMVKYARHKMHDADKVPAAYRQYFIRDMDFANGEAASVKRSAPIYANTEKAKSPDTCNYAFFPGCNLGALDPEYVLKPYKWLLSQDPHTALLLRCCGVPVDWNGDKDLHDKEVIKLKNDWEDLGKPVLIMACMSCRKHINEYLPEIKTISLYEIMVNLGFKKTKAVKSSDIYRGSAFTESPKEIFSVFDPCSARNQDDVQSSVRALAASSGICTEELPKGDKHGCCGFGGMGSIAAPDFAEYVAEKRSELSENPYLVYCSNCRDVFCDRGKKAVHILDILFDIDAECVRPQPDVTQRRINRTILKKRLLKEIWKEEFKMETYENKCNLIISDEIREKINKQKILAEDICEVISHSEATGRRTFDPETCHYKAYKEIGYITCWVEYSPADSDYEIHNVYTHRMKIELEAVFNGRKIDM